MGTVETLANVQLVRFQGFSGDLCTSQNFSTRKTWPRGLRHPLTQKCGTARNGLSLNEQAKRPGRPISPDRCRCEGSWSQEVADGSDRSVREERPSGG